MTLSQIIALGLIIIPDLIYIAYKIQKQKDNTYSNFLIAQMCRWMFTSSILVMFVIFNNDLQDKAKGKCPEPPVCPTYERVEVPLYKLK